MRILCRDYTIDYSGGRLAEVLIYGRAVEAVPVRSLIGGYDVWAEPEPTEAQVRERVADWIEPENLPHYREAARASIAAERAHERACTDPRCQCGKRR